MPTCHPSEAEFVVDDTLGFFAVDRFGRVKLPDLVRAWEQLAPRWWYAATGGTREAHWRRSGHHVVTSHIQILRRAGGARPGDATRLRLRTTAGLRPRSGRGAAAGALDRFTLEVRDTGEALGEIVHAWTWIDTRGAAPAVAGQPPEGIDAPQHDLPALPAMPDPREAEEALPGFRWRERETDRNGHVSFLSYFDRADEALEVDAGPMPECWEAWYRRECLAGEAVLLLVGPRVPAGRLVVLADPDDRHPRVVLRHRLLNAETSR